MSEQYPEKRKQKEDNIAISAKGGTIAFSMNIVSVVLGLLNQIILARLLGASGVGEILLVLSVINVSARFSKFGLDGAMMRFIPMYQEKNDAAKIKGTIFFALKFSLSLSFVFVFFIIYFSQYISSNIFHVEGLSRLLMIVAIALPANVIRSVIGGVLKGYRETFKALLPECVILPFTRIVIFLLLILNEISVVYAIAAFVLGEFLALIISIVFILSSLSKIRHVKHETENSKVLGVASTMIFTNLTMIIYMQASLWVISYYLSTEAVGIYGVVYRLVRVVSFALMSFATIVPPLISASYTLNDHSELRRLIGESSRWILTLAMPIILFLILEGKFILEYAYGEKFAAGYSVLLILCLGQLINAGSGLVGMVMQMTGGHKALMRITLFWGVVSILLNIMLVQSIGIEGAAFSTAFCLAMVNIVSVIVVYKKISILTIAKGVKFDIVFSCIVGIIYCLCNRYELYFGYHILFISALAVYAWKSIANKDLPIGLVFSRFMK